MLILRAMYFANSIEFSDMDYFSSFPIPHTQPVDRAEDEERESEYEKPVVVHVAAHVPGQEILGSNKFDSIQC